MWLYSNEVLSTDDCYCLTVLPQLCLTTQPLRFHFPHPALNSAIASNWLRNSLVNIKMWRVASHGLNRKLQLPYYEIVTYCSSFSQFSRWCDCRLITEQKVWEFPLICFLHPVDWLSMILLPLSCGGNDKPHECQVSLLNWHLPTLKPPQLSHQTVSCQSLAFMLTLWYFLFTLQTCVDVTVLRWSDFCSTEWILCDWKGWLFVLYSL